MKPLHVTVAAFNLLCLGALLVAFMVAPGAIRERLASFAVVAGYFANVVALVVSLVLLLLLGIRLVSGGAASTLRNNWLGVANGAAVVFAWVLFLVSGGVTH